MAADNWKFLNWLGSLLEKEPSIAHARGGGENTPT